MGKVRIFLIQKREGGLKLAGKGSVDEDKEAFTVNKKSYKLDSRAYIQGYKWWPIKWPATWCFYDIDNSKPIYFKSDAAQSSKDFNTFLKSEAVGKIVSAERDKKYLIVIMVLGLAVMLVGGWGIYNMNQSNARIAELALKIANLTKSSGVIVIP